MNFGDTQNVVAALAGVEFHIRANVPTAYVSIVPPEASGTIDDYIQFLTGIKQEITLRGWRITDTYGDPKEAFGELCLTIERDCTQAELDRIKLKKLDLDRRQAVKAAEIVAEADYNRRPDIVRIRAVMAQRGI